MIYLVGFIGFIGGFIFGQMVLYFFLRNRSREELLNDKNLKYTYGLANWIIAGLSAYGLVTIYSHYFTAP